MPFYGQRSVIFSEFHNITEISTVIYFCCYLRNLLRCFFCYILQLNDYRGHESLKAAACIYLKYKNASIAIPLNFFQKKKSWLFRGTSFRFIQQVIQSYTAMGLYKLFQKCNNQRGLFCVHGEVPPVRQAHSPCLSVLIQFILHADPMVSQYEEFAVFSFYHPFGRFERMASKEVCSIYAVYCSLNYTSLRVCSHASPCLEILRQN